MATKLKKDNGPSLEISKEMKETLAQGWDKDGNPFGHKKPRYWNKEYKQEK